VDTGRDQASLWRVINDGLGRGGDGAPVADPGLCVEAFADYFDRKVADIRSATDGASPPVFRDISTSDRLSTFVPVTTDVATNAHCAVTLLVETYSRLPFRVYIPNDSQPVKLICSYYACGSTHKTCSTLA